MKYKGLLRQTPGDESTIVVSIIIEMWDLNFWKKWPLEPTFIVEFVINDMMYVKKILRIPCEFAIGYIVKHGEYCC